MLLGCYSKGNNIICNSTVLRTIFSLYYGHLWKCIHSWEGIMSVIIHIAMGDFKKIHLTDFKLLEQKYC